jgi:Zn finger protein HypA/HybF involved in hydrogenase expression
MDALMLDGNAVAGLLREVFAVEMTTAVAICAGCGADEPLGATHVFRGAGIVMRCPHCGNTLATIVAGERGMSIGLGGIRSLQVDVESGD